jgi:glucose uptake protein
MILPHTYFAALLIAILSGLCWGSWANTCKMAGKWRFELFYWDFALGAMVAATVAAFTVGTLGFDGFLFMDDLMRAGRRSIAYGAAAGGIFNLGNLFLVASISLAGISVAFPLGAGVGMIVASVWRFAAGTKASPTLLFAGIALVVAALVIDVVAHRRLELAKAKQTIKAGRGKSTIPQVGWSAVVLGIIGGLLLGSFQPLIQMGTTGDAGLGPFAMAFVFTAGLFLTTFVFNLFFMNLPVKGQPVEPRDYFRGSLKKHAIGLLGGAIWVTGTIASLVVALAPDTRLSGALAYGLGEGSIVIAALWGLLAWKEFRDAEIQARTMMSVMVVLLGVGIALVSLAPQYAK